MSEPADAHQDVKRGCNHLDVTVTEDGGRCNQCRADLVFHHSSGNWLHPEKPFAAVEFRAAASGLWYRNPLAAAAFDAIRCNGVLMKWDPKCGAITRFTNE